MKNEIKEKTMYCLGCIKKPCQKGCPLHNDITAFIKELKNNNQKEAYNILSQTTVLSSICGRICPHENQCQGHCIRGIKGEPVSIGALEAFVGDKALEENWFIPLEETEKKKEKIAVIGSGPSSLTCAAFLARNGYNVTIYEKYTHLGGLLAHGIPEFRLPKEIVEKTIAKIISLGIQVEYEKELGNNLSLSFLEENYDAIFLGMGGNKTNKINVPGEDLKGVYEGNALLETKKHPNYKNKKIIIIGGGNVAMDISRTIKSQGAKEVIILYRRSKEEMPAQKEELQLAEKEGIEFRPLTNIVAIKGKTKVAGIECIKTELQQEDNHIIAVNIPNTNAFLPCDYVVKATGSHPEENLVKNLEIEWTEKQYIKVNESSQTSKPNIFAGGDIAGCQKTVAFAARSGKDAATQIMAYLKKKTKTIE